MLPVRAGVRSSWRQSQLVDVGSRWVRYISLMNLFELHSDSLPSPESKVILNERVKQTERETAQLSGGQVCGWLSFVLKKKWFISVTELHRRRRTCTVYLTWSYITFDMLRHIEIFRPIIM